MKTKKGEHILIEELESMLDDDDWIDESYLASVLAKRPHVPDVYAMRRGRTLHRHRQVWVRYKRR